MPQRTNSAVVESLNFIQSAVRRGLVKMGGGLAVIPFEPLELGGFQELGSGAGEVFGIANRFIGLKDFFQQTLALGQGFAAKVAAIEIEQIEQEKDGGEEAG